MSDDQTGTVEITLDGYVRIPPELSVPNFPNDRCAGLRKGAEYVLIPATVYAQNALIMKQRTPAGQRSVLIREVWGDDYPVGEFPAMWQAKRRRLLISTSAASPAAGSEARP